MNHCVLAFNVLGKTRIKTLPSIAASPPMLVMESSRLLIRRIHHEGTTPAQRSAAAMEGLLPDLAEPPGDHLVTLVSPGETEGWVVLCSRSALNDEFRVARDNGFRCRYAVPDVFFLPEAGSGEAFIARRDGLWLCRTDEMMFCAERPLLSAVIDGLAVQEVDFERCVAERCASPQGLAAPRLAAPPQPADLWRIARTPLVALSCAALIFSLSPWLSVWRLEHEVSRLHTEIGADATSVLNEARPIRLPLARLREAALPLIAMTEAAGIAEIMLVEGQRTGDFTAVRLEYGDDRVVLAFSASDPATAGKLTSALQERGLSADLTQSQDGAGSPRYHLMVSGQSR